MVKPSQPSSPATSRQRKRRKISANQTKLDVFFSSPSQRTPKKERDNKELWAHETRNSPSVLQSAEDGLHLETMQALETGWHERKLQSDVLPNETDDNADPEEGHIGCSQNVCEASISSQPSDLRANQLTAVSSSGKTVNPEVFERDVGPPDYQQLSQDPFTFDIEHQPWRAASPAPYSFLAHTLSELSNTRSRIAITNTLTNCLRTIIRFHSPSLLPALYLLSNVLAPPYASVELGLGPSVISKAIQHVSGLSPQGLKRLYITTGDIGDVAYHSKSRLRTLVPHAPLIIIAVYDSLLKIANTNGPGAVKQKQAIVEKLLVAAKGEEVRFLVRTLSQNLRVGAVRTTLLSALARAMVLSPPPAAARTDSIYYTRLPGSQEKALGGVRDELIHIFGRAEALTKSVYVQHPNYDDIVRVLLESGLDGLREGAPLIVGVPLLPTLGSPVRSVDDIYECLGDLHFSAEFKYDGQRAQIHAHREDDREVEVKIFSRHLEDMTTKYPDIVVLVNEIFQNSSEIRSFIIDSEIVAVDSTDGTLKSFQDLSNRARKDVAISDVKITVAVFAFDIMYLNGEVLIEQPFSRRKSLLQTRLPPLTSENVKGAQFRHVESCESQAGRNAIEAFWGKAVRSQCEGLMIKLLDGGEVSQESAGRRKPLLATYEPDKRTFAWLKLKKDYVSGVGDSLDLVPIGAWHGNGRKAQWWSPILLGLYDPGLEKLVAVCKCMSGFTDAFYKDLKERYPEDSDTCSTRPLWGCEMGGLTPNVFFKPQEVWEIRGADVTLSPVSVAALGMVSPSRGLSLRFPRFVRIKEDKAIEMASRPEFLASMYRTQLGKGENKVGANEDELLDVDIVEGELFDFEN